MTDPTESNSKNMEKLAESVDKKVILGEDGKPLSKNALKKLQKEQEKARKKAEFKQQQQQQQQADQTPDYSKERYGILPVNQSQKRERRERVLIRSLNDRESQTVLLRARIHTTRAKGKQCFMVLRQQADTVQAVLAVDKEQQKISKQMVKFAGGLVLCNLIDMLIYDLMIA